MGREMLLIGEVLAVLSVCFLIGFVVCLLSKRKSWFRKKRRLKHTESFLLNMEKAYEVSGTVRQMLYLIVHEYPEGDIHDAVQEAIYYLEQSKYKDYETALTYCSDGSEAYERLSKRIIETEAMKKNRIAMK